MDKAPLRRGKNTVHEKWNPNIALLSGDVLLVKAYEQLSKSKAEKIPALLHLFNATAAEVCEGQQLDMDFETAAHTGIGDYLHMISLKTAVLLGCSLKMGALTANANESDAQHLYEFGKQTGIAFQLKDDILDVYGEAEKFGKQVGGDILSNKKTFLLLSALQRADESQKKEMQHWLSKKNAEPGEKIKAVKKIYDALNIFQISEEEMNAHYQKALHHLELISANDEKKKQLRAFTDELMKREN
jgi:geranylgeranyl diphosphate synthase type II